MKYRTFHNAIAMDLHLRGVQPETLTDFTFSKKLFMRINCIVIVLFIGLIQVHGKGYGQTISLNLKRVTLHTALTQIEHKSDYVFFYNKGDIPEDIKIDASFQSADMPQILSTLFKGTDIEFEIFDNTVVLKKTDTNVKNRLEDIRVSGQVRDSTGILQGVSITVKNSPGLGTSTDAQGRYTILVPDNAVLVFKYVGYIQQELTVAGQSLINVELKPDMAGLDEVVVVGYGQQSRKSLTTSIARVTSKDIGIQPVGTPGETLAGLAAGVQVQSGRGGTPGAPPSIRVRGIGSIGGSNDVLYVVDGYPLQNPVSFNQISPSDIESIEILKDAASAAIYGSRAANGVVLVTTKRGTPGDTRFSLNAYTGIQQVAKKLDLLNTTQFVPFAKRVAEIRGVAYPDILNDPSNLPNTDWQDLIYRDGMVSDFQLSATGGTEKVKYLISGSYFDQEGTLKGTDYKRYSLRINTDADLSNKLKIGISMTPTYSEQHRMPATGQWNNTSDGDLGRSLPNILQSAYLMPPVIPYKTANGDYGQPNADPATSQYGFFGSNLFNPMATIEQVTNRFRNFSFLGNTYLAWNPIENLQFKTSFGANFNLTDQYGYIPPTVPTNNAYTANINNPVFTNIWSVESEQRDIDYLWENTVNYTLDFGSNKNNHLKLLGIASAQRFSSKLVSANGKIGTYSNQVVQNPSASTDIQGSIGYDENAFISFGGRATYDYADRYFLAAAIRTDGSSKFGPDNQYSSFPSLSAAWALGDEKFMSNLKPWLSDLKLRLSYGETGNANIGSFTWANSINASNYQFGTTRNLGSVMSGLSNYQLTWEKNKQFDLGVDFGLIRNQINVGIDYYKRNTDGMLLNRDLPGIIGYASTTRTNLGSLQNKGLELSINTSFQLGQVRYTADYNFSTNTNKVTSLGGPDALPSQTGVYGWGNMYQVEVGKPLGNINGFTVEGVFKNEEDLARYPQWNGNGNLVGDWRIKDVNGDGIINESDREVLGNAIPKYTFGTTQRFNYKGFDLTLMIQGVEGVHLLRGDARQLYYNINGMFNVPTDVLDNFFDPAFPDRDVKYHRVNGNTGVNMNNQATNYSVLDASYIRLRNFTIGYNIPKSLTNTLKLQQVRFYLSGQNLLTITSYPGTNPEASTNSSASLNAGSSDSAFLPGIDHGAYPATRTFTIGVNIGF